MDKIQKHLKSNQQKKLKTATGTDKGIVRFK